MDDDRPGWYLPIGEPLDRRRAELVVATFGGEVKRVGRGLVARMGARRPGTKITRKLLSVDELVMYGQRPRTKDARALYLAVASYDDPNHRQACGVVLLWETGEVVTTGELGGGR